MNSSFLKDTTLAQQTFFFPLMIFASGFYLKSALWAYFLICFVCLQPAQFTRGWTEQFTECAHRGKANLKGP